MRRSKKARRFGARGAGKGFAKTPGRFRKNAAKAEKRKMRRGFKKAARSAMRNLKRRQTRR
jgi:hypothetical protein